MTLKHIFQKNAIEFETRATRHEQRDTRQEDNLYDSVCDVMRFRIFTEISVENPWFLILASNGQGLAPATASYALAGPDLA